MAGNFGGIVKGISGGSVPLPPISSSAQSEALGGVTGRVTTNFGNIGANSKSIGVFGYAALLVGLVIWLKYKK